MESSTTTRSPDLLLVILLLLEHLSSLTGILLDSKLRIIHSFPTVYSSQTVLGLELLDVIKAIIDQSKSSGSTASYND